MGDVCGSRVPSPCICGQCDEAIPSTANAEDAKMTGKNVAPGEELAEVHHRTPSTTTASTSSMETTAALDWWVQNSPWPWQWANVGACCEPRQGSDGVTALPEGDERAACAVEE